MDHAGFEEKQYDNALQLELAAGQRWCYPSGPVLEAVLGYDFVAIPGKEAIWDLLQARCPPGIVLTPALWPSSEQPSADRLPLRHISLIVQAKRPVYLNHWRAGQYDYWRGPYYRFTIDGDQQLILAHLEQAVDELALVRYAAPAFVAYSDLLRHQDSDQVAEHSTFVEPSTLTGHRVWTYSGPGLTGYANPNGEGIGVPADTFESLRALALRLAAEATLAEHIVALSNAVTGVHEALRFEVGRVRRFRYQRASLDEADLPEEERDVLRAWLEVAHVVAWAGASWMVWGFDE